MYMLKFNKASANTIVVTLKEKTTLSPVYYLWQFESKQSGVKRYCIATDISQYKDRYNEFVITETSTPTPTNGQISLAEGGEWNYTVYEQSSNSNLNPTGLTVVERGIAKVIPTPTTEYVHTPNNTVAIYNG